MNVKYRVTFDEKDGICPKGQDHHIIEIPKGNLIPTLICHGIQDEFNHMMKLYKISISKKYFDNLSQQNQQLEAEYDEVKDIKIEFQIPHYYKKDNTSNTEYLRNFKTVEEDS